MKRFGVRGFVVRGVVVLGFMVLPSIALAQSVDLNGVGARRRCLRS